ncbi:hypothetical protein [Kineococcus esterisolvens]
MLLAARVDRACSRLLGALSRVVPARALDSPVVVLRSGGRGPSGLVRSL